MIEWNAPFGYESKRVMERNRSVEQKSIVFYLGVNYGNFLSNTKIIKYVTKMRTKIVKYQFCVQHVDLLLFPLYR